MVASRRVKNAWPVEIHPIGLVACATTLWRFRGQLRVTAIVKAAFSFVQGDAMELEEPDDVLVDDVPYGGDPWTLVGLGPAWGAGDAPPDATRSAWAAGDLAPFRLQADVTLVGRAFLPSGRGAVRLAVFGEHLLVDKKLRVVRQADEALPVPLVYERALGGAGSPDNPAGTGLSPGSPLPDLTDPADPRRPVGLAPIPRWWPARAQLLGTLDPSLVTQRTQRTQRAQRTHVPSILEVPADFDWAYFQAAPPGQVVDFLRGDEWVRLEGMDEEHPILQSRLPSATAAGRAYGLHGPDGPAVPVAFRADNLHIDADRRRCSVTYRASFSIASAEVLAQLVLLAGVELPGYPIRWPESVHRAPPVVEAAAPPQEDPEHAATVELRREPRPAERQSTVLMEWGEAGAPEAPPRSRSATVMMDWGAAGVPAPPPAETPPQRQSTVLMEWPAGAAPLLEARGPMPTVVLEWGGGAPNAAHLLDPNAPSPLEGTMVWSDDDAIEVVLDDDHPLMGTLALSDDQAAGARSMRAPFRLPAPGAPRGEAPRAEIAGAPWASTQAPAVPRPTDEHTRALVLPPSLWIRDDLLAELPVKPVAEARVVAEAKPVVEARVVAEARGVAEAPLVAEGSWQAPSIAQAPWPALPPEAPREIARPTLKARIYERFGPVKK